MSQQSKREAPMTSSKFNAMQHKDLGDRDNDGTVDEAEDRTQDRQLGDGHTPPPFQIENQPEGTITQPEGPGLSDENQR